MLFLCGLVLKGYANRVRFLARHEMPPIFSAPRFSSKFWLARLLITYGALFGIWVAHGFRVQIGAFIVYFLVSMFTFFLGSRRSVKKWAAVDFRRQKKEAEERGEVFDEEVAKSKASQRSEKIVEEHIGFNGNL